MNSPSPIMPTFQAFQAAFARRCRDPRTAPRPAGVPVRRMTVYEELLFNNITGFLDACFPVCRTLIGSRRWRRLNRAFFRDWRSHTPWFRGIPAEFVHYLEHARQRLPAWFRQLAHYEWIELAVDTCDAPEPAHSPTGDLMAGVPIVSPTLRRLSYDWPVHRIGAGYRPRKRQPTQLIVYRDGEHVRFAEINPVTERLLAVLAEGRLTGIECCQSVACALGHPSAQAVFAHGAAVLAELHGMGAILGTRP